jgi:phage FluMu protein Com
MQKWSQVRCPTCGKLVAEASPGSRLRVKCSRCRDLFERSVGPGTVS